VENQRFRRGTPTSRHNFAIRIPSEHGFDGHRDLLGHSSQVTSEIYAALDETKAIEAIFVCVNRTLRGPQALSSEGFVYGLEPSRPRSFPFALFAIAY
jgi:hypothetical protein